MKVFIPTGPAAAPAKSMRRDLDSVAGKVIGIIDNTMPNGNDLVDDIDALLVKQYQVAKVIKFRKQPKGLTPEDVMTRLTTECDAIIVGMGNSGAPVSWCARDSVRAASSGKPVVHLGTDEFVALGRTVAQSLGHADLPMIAVKHPFTQETREEVRAAAPRVTEQLVNALLGKDRPAAGKARAADAAPKRAELIDAPDGMGEFNQFFFERGWSDGLPVIPPTPELVAEMLRYTRRKPDEILATIPPHGTATVEAVAIVAVMAGCRPEYLPVLIAAVEAIGEPEFDLVFLQNTIHPTTTWLVVNGPIAQRLKIHGGVGCLGPGYWANATLGRALRLVCLIIGGARSGEVSMSCMAWAGKFLMCCAENEAESPWEPLHVEKGFPKESSTVTVIAAKAPMSFTTHTQDVDDFLTIIGNAMTGITSSEHRSGGAPTLILSPEHARMVANHGLSKADFKRRVWEAGRLPVSKMSIKERARTQEERRADMGEFTDDTLLTPSKTPEDITILVAGGKGMCSNYVPCHAPIAWPVTRVIDEWAPAS